MQPAGLLDGLKGDAADAGLLQRELNDGAHFVVVDAALDRHDERGGDVERVEFFEGFRTDAAEVGAAELHQRVAALGVELEVELELRHVRREALGEAFFGRETDAVGVDHQVLDGPALRGVEDSEEFGVDGRLAAGYLDDVGLDLVRDDRIEHGLDLVERLVGRAVRSALGVADGAA